MKIAEIITEGQYNHSIQSIKDTPIHPDEYGNRYLRRSDKSLLRGPHQGRILSLMLAKKKPAASVDVTDIMGKFRQAIRDGKIKVIGEFPSDRVDEYIVTLPGEEWRGRQLMKIWPMLRNADDIETEKRIHAKIGTLLGYPKEAIRSFINQRT